jgi:hypothetical protein
MRRVRRREVQSVLGHFRESSSPVTIKARDRDLLGRRGLEEEILLDARMIIFSLRQRAVGKTIRLISAAGRAAWQYWKASTIAN